MNSDELSVLGQRSWGTELRNEEIARRAEAGEGLSEIARRFGITRQRVDQILKREKKRARNAVGCAIQSGKLVRPDRCETCGRIGEIDAHHDDYEKRLSVRWLCRYCHSAADSERQGRPRHRMYRDPMWSSP